MWRQLNSEVLTSGEIGPKQVNKKIPVSDKYVKKTKCILVSSFLLPVSSPSHKPSRLWKQSVGFCFSCFSLIFFTIVANTSGYLLSCLSLSPLSFSCPSVSSFLSSFLPSSLIFSLSPLLIFFKLIDLRVC